MTLQIFENKALGFSVNYFYTTEDKKIVKKDGTEKIKQVKKYWFKGNEVAEKLGYSHPRPIIVKKVSNKYKKTLSELGVAKTATHQDSTIFINESGLYELILSSHLPECESFKEWIIEDVIPTIRETGKYEVDFSVTNNYNKKTDDIKEKDLQKKVVKYIRTINHPIIPTLGDLAPNAQTAALAKNLGYTKGSPDIFLPIPNYWYHGLFIEFKTPKGDGKLSIEQKEMILNLRKKRYDVLVSNSYEEIICYIHDYMKEIGYYCEICFTNKEKRLLQFKTEKNLNIHKRRKHNIDIDDE